MRSGYGGRMRSVTASDGTAAAPIFQPVGGMDQFPKGFQRAIGASRFTFNADVQSVHQDDQGVYVNFLGDEGPERVRQAYPGATWERLAAVKRRWDPTNLFRRNQNIPPTTT